MYLLIHARIKVHPCTYINARRPLLLLRCTYYSCTLTTLQCRHNGSGGISNHQSHYCLLNRVFRLRSKKTSKPRVTGLCAGNSPLTGKFPAQMASNAKNEKFSIWWCYYDNEIVFGTNILEKSSETHVWYMSKHRPGSDINRLISRQFWIPCNQTMFMTRGNRKMLLMNCNHIVSALIWLAR